MALTFNSKMQRLAARLVQGVRCRTDVATSTASCYALQDEALIRPDDPRRRVVRQDLILQKKKKISIKIHFITQRKRDF